MTYVKVESELPKEAKQNLIVLLSRLGGNIEAVEELSEFMEAMGIKK